MRSLILSLDALPHLRDATASDVDLAAVATLAELAGADGVRLGVNEDLKPVGDQDVMEARRASRFLELRIPASQSLLRVALQARPDRVVLASAARDGRSPSAPFELRPRSKSLTPMIRALAEAGIPVSVVIAPDLEVVKNAHTDGITAVEFFTAGIVDLPGPERRAELGNLSDAVRLAAKLRMTIGLGGGLGYRNVRDVMEAAPAAEWVTVGRAALSRAVLVGVDRAVRDLRARLE